LNKGLAGVKFEGMENRTDIGHRALAERATPAAGAKQPIRIAILGSTRGTSAQAVIDAVQATNGKLSGGEVAEIVVVLSNLKASGILEKARTHGLPWLSVSGMGKQREEFDDEVTAKLEEHNVDMVLMVGYMRIVSDKFVRKWAGRVLNVHPSLLPAFAGGMDLDVHQAVLDAGVEDSGCTVHFVTEVVDGGPIAVQLSTPVFPGETAADLKRHVQALEGRALVRAVQMFAAGDLDKQRAQCVHQAAQATSTSADAPAAPMVTYKDAGVNIHAGYDLVKKIGPLCKATQRAGCDADLGGFGGVFDLSAAGFGVPGSTGGGDDDTLIVGCTDGVGTKLKVAQIAGIHHTVGVDLVSDNPHPPPRLASFGSFQLFARLTPPSS
jgi:phosphoribosylamine--glycine ligase/phosphoribosylglycinamide formyltransferase/phosphoribosylformylglycinamidine cyclo-ligase/phosphoribosylamine--glycine ligase/phosphoribosylformylglycinamidine cyclo-ligase